MKLAFAVVAVFWWIAIWGLSDVLTEHWSRESKIEFYIGLLVLIAIIIWLVPSTLDRL